jgi:hypothetical protein
MCKDHAVARSGNHLELDLEVNLVQTETFWLVTKSGAIGKMSSGKCTTNRATGVESHYLKWKNMELFMNASTQTVKHCSKYKNLGFLPPKKHYLVRHDLHFVITLKSSDVVSCADIRLYSCAQVSS